MGKSIAVVGCGPKGAAIAAKAAALRLCGHKDLSVVVFEPIVGAHWIGSHGYTDGDQPLCTQAERDLGYPYEPSDFYSRRWPGVPDAMLKEFSWPSFMTRDAGYDDWISRGRRPPTHKEFVRYLQYAIDAACATGAVRHIEEKVVAIDRDWRTGMWQVTSEQTTQRQPFDGVVITGSGAPTSALPHANARVFDGKSFWLKGADILALLAADPDPAVAIIGSGGTAAAVALWMHQNRPRTPVYVIGRQATIYARVATHFEERLFADDEAWTLLAPHIREQFVRRLTRGTVWASVLDELTDAAITYYPYEAVEFFARPQVTTPAGRHPAPPLPDELTLRCKHPDPPNGRSGAHIPNDIPASVFIDATGFDPWWFVDELMSQGSLRDLLCDPPVSGGGRKEYETNIGEALDLGGLVMPTRRFPLGLHVPMLASQIGPAATNLMALGWMSDRILRPYV